VKECYVKIWLECKAIFQSILDERAKGQEERALQVQRRCGKLVTLLQGTIEAIEGRYGLPPVQASSDSTGSDDTVDRQERLTQVRKMMAGVLSYMHHTKKIKRFITDHFSYLSSSEMDGLITQVYNLDLDISQTNILIKIREELERLKSLDQRLSSDDVSQVILKVYSKNVKADITKDALQQLQHSLVDKEVKLAEERRAAEAKIADAEAKIAELEHRLQQASLSPSNTPLDESDGEKPGKFPRLKP
jgi:hypothetical protein